MQRLTGYIDTLEINADSKEHDSEFEIARTPVVSSIPPGLFKTLSADRKSKLIMDRFRLPKLVSKRNNKFTLPHSKWSMKQHSSTPDRKSKHKKQSLFRSNEILVSTMRAEFMSESPHLTG